MEMKMWGQLFDILVLAFFFHSKKVLFPRANNLGYFSESEIQILWKSNNYRMLSIKDDHWKIKKKYIKSW